ncbi:TPA: hypothetical protein KNO10_002149 [Clostridioides difficile]|uniref:hypothetical protein n=1 Tax=Clostridioides difficile TaxID=1496 RepID=UPI00038D1AA6|nr:hypothetical protein [Clostridioides difficile]EQG38332.1 hypothetical protein QIO_0532 [Clostridioides difficile DA00129]SJQ30786.1 Uncharacterised protein [Clostridioides difficile]SJR41828.1 Uncharacterised protein [Clostridioides difficile]HBF0262868.1 hypothetical protein [Clostridioides difficile]HBF0728997.1 hypothetical protein [Clostridioides difficile]
MKLNIFDMIINKDIFKYNKENIYDTLINSFANEIHEDDIKIEYSIIIFTINKQFIYEELIKATMKNKYITIKHINRIAHYIEIELKCFNTDRLIKVLIFDRGIKSRELRGYSCECVIVDVNTSNEIIINSITEQIEPVLFSMNVYKKEYKPFHGVLLFK